MASLPYPADKNISSSQSWLNVLRLINFDHDFQENVAVRNIKERKCHYKDKMRNQRSLILFTETLVCMWWYRVRQNKGNNLVAI